MGENIFVQSSDRCTDGEKSLNDRAAHNEELKKAVKDKLPEKYAAIAWDLD